MTDARHPIIVGVGQVTLRGQEWPDLAGPMELMLEAVSLADTDAGGSVLGHVDHLTVNNIFCWDYGNAPALLARGLGLDHRAELRYLGIGGNSGQRAVNEISARLATGEIEVALVAGAEAFAARRAARKAGHRVDWGSHSERLDPPEEREPNHAIETAAGVEQPLYSYPLWEPALRAVAGRSLEEHSEYIGGLMSRFTDVAAENPHAWFPQRRGAEDLMTVTEANRMIALPYTKSVNAIMQVDQGAALLLTTVGKARSLGIPEDAWVYVIGGGDCNDIWYLTERVSYDRSPGMRKVAEQTWRSSGLGIDDIAHLDLYSCFPSAVQLAMEAFGIAPDDPRPMTVTGGLAYAGGPGNNYTTHSVAAMTHRLRENPGEAGLCTGLGWHVTKHSAGLYSSRPPTASFRPVDSGRDQKAVEAERHPAIEAAPSGRALVEGYTVAYSRDGVPEKAICLARLDVGRRTIVSSDDTAVAAALAEGEWFGREVEVSAEGALDV